MDPQRLGAVAEVVGLDQARQAEVVVGMEMGDEDVVERDEPGRALQLPLCSLAAVEQQPIAAEPDEHRSRIAAGARRRRPGAEEDDVEIHGGSVFLASPPLH